MKKFLALLLAAGAATAAHAGTNVGVTIDINQPGVYGRVILGNAPPPVVVYPQPMIIAPTPVAVYQQPIYLYVSPLHQRHWAKYCGLYRACGQPVYFVQEQWVRERYERAYPPARHEAREPHRREHGQRIEQRQEHRAEGRREQREGDHR